LGQWRQHGFSAAAEHAWRTRVPQISEIDEVLAWRDAGFGTEETAAWLAVSLAFSAQEAVEWKAAGFAPDTVRSWYLARWIRSADHAASWRGAGFASEDADAWLDVDSTLRADQARTLCDAGFTPAHVDAWLADLDAMTIADAIFRSPGFVLRLRLRRCDGPEAESTSEPPRSLPLDVSRGVVNNTTESPTLLPG